MDTGDRNLLEYETDRKVLDKSSALPNKHPGSITVVDGL